MPLQATSGAASYDAFGGGVPVVPNYIEDVFSTYLYTGNGSTQTITNGIDLAGKGGLVWCKSRMPYDTSGNVTNHVLMDSVTDGRLRSNTTGALLAGQNITRLSSGFTVTGTELNSTTSDGTPPNNYVSWTFREQSKFFDVVTWTGDASGNRVLNHALTSTPACIIIKATNAVDDWYVYHTSLGTNKWLYLNTTSAEQSGSIVTAVSSTTFTVSQSNGFNTSGRTYVAYLFAHNAGGFGLTGTDNVISCGSYTGNGSATGPVITLGYEPQWVMVKRATGTANGNWVMLDVMRGFSTSTDNELYANLSLAEGSGLDLAEPQATGFQIKSASSGVNASGSDYIYIAIRRGPMKVPTSGTSVFSPNISSGSVGTVITTNFPVDMQINAVRDITFDKNVVDRLRGVITTPTDTLATRLRTNLTNAEGDNFYSRGWNNTGFQMPTTIADASDVFYNFRRAPSFFDEVCYTGTGASSQTKTHNLGVTPELMIIKNRGPAGYTQNWVVYPGPLGTDQYLYLNSTNGAGTFGAFWGNTPPTSTGFTVGNYQDTNASTLTYVAYLFATCAGVSKVGSYTGTGTTLQVNCGFTGGARFVLIKKTSGTGSWYVWDSARGIVSGNDPYLLLNSTAAEVTSTDYIDTYSAGFEISSTAPSEINENGGSFIFLAIS